MKKWTIGILIAVAAVALGVGGAFLYNSLNPLTSNSSQNLLNIPDENGPGFGFGNWGRGSSRNGGGMGQPGRPMLPYTQAQGASGQRISVDDAVASVQKYLKNDSADLKISEVMEFQSNFYVLVTETQTGRGAMELLVDPYSGAVTPEFGPNRMWNLKYGPMNRMMGTTASENTLTKDEALTRAQAALSQKYPGATVNEDGINFYGYYTFDYSIDGQVAGMLSVNGLDGQVWLHTWHGDFISEKEID